MSCGCKDPKPTEPKSFVGDIPSSVGTTPVKPSRLAIHCYCGLTRLIPAGLKFNEEFTLTPCNKCGSSFRGRLEADGVVELA